MSAYRYLIVGGGMTADAAAHGIRELDRDGAIGVFSAEPDPPYNRPPLSKGLWKGEPLDGIWRKTGEAAVELNLGRRVTSLDLTAKTVVDDRGDRHGYEKLLLATGATPRRLPFGGEDVIYYRGIEDYRRLRRIADTGGNVAVIGGGFIGSEIAAGLAMSGCKVSLLFPEEGIGARIFPADLARFLIGYYREHGVDVMPGEPVTGITSSDGTLAVATMSGSPIAADAVVAGVGVVPETGLAEAAGIAVADGIMVDEHLRTSMPDVFAAGDMARFMSPQLGKRIRVEHEDNALTMGRAAGRAMAGDTTVYQHLPFFYSDLFDLGYEAVGETDSRLEVVADWKTPFREGVLYYLAAGRVRGVLLWGIFGKVDEARAVIADERASDAAGIKGRIQV